MLEKRINNLLNNIKLPEFDLEKLENQKGYDYLEKKKKKLPYVLSTLTTLCACLLLFVYCDNNLITKTTIGMDVNPSVEIKVNKNNKVLDVIANNEDGKIILNDMDLKDSNINVAVNALIGSMVQNGYIDELANSILISVENKDEKYAESLRQEILSKLSTNNLSIISQTLDVKNDLTKIANEYNISTGKAQIIEQIIANNNLHSFDDLANLSINELNLILNDATMTTGNAASENAYIGNEKAKEIAMKHAGVTEVTNLFIELDFDDIMVYEIEFLSGNKEYDYEINATTGEVIEYSIDTHKNITNNITDTDDDNKLNNTQNDNSTNTTNNTSNNTTTQKITQEEAKSIALKHAGISNVSKVNIETDDNKYEINFYYNNTEYEYDISFTGNIIKYSQDNKYKEPTPNITQEEAKNIALKHAKVSNVSKIDIELDDNKYEISFYHNNIEYEYEINATTGTIIKYDKEDHNPTSSNIISSDKAKNIAIKDANVKEYYNFEIKLDDGKYEIEFKSNNIEYEYEINATTGTIIKKETD